MSNVIPINSRAIAAAAIRAKLREAANASGRLGSLEDTIDLIRYECDRFAWLAPPAEKGKSRKLTVFELNKRNQEFESTPLRQRVPLQPIPGSGVISWVQVHDGAHARISLASRYLCSDRRSPTNR